MSILIDVRYAIRQLRNFGAVCRALDALERVEENLCRSTPDPLSLDDELQVVHEELLLRDNWLKEKGRYEEFDQWASLRRDA